MRIKLYYTADEITNNLYTTGSEFMLESKKEYKGPYHKYITGEVYTESVWNATTSKKLLPFKQTNSVIDQYQKLKPSIQIKTITPNQSIIKITKSDIKSTVIKRYFIKRYDSLNVLEIDSLQYKLWQSNKIDKNIYTAVMIDWYIAGAVDDVNQNGVLVLGVRSKNIKQIKYANSILPGITSFLTDPLQYYTDTNFTVPKDINS